VPRFFFGGRQFGRRRALDLVASEIADLQQRSEKPPAVDPVMDRLHQAMTVSGGWCAPVEPLWAPLDLPDLSVKRGGIEFSPCPTPDKSWLVMESSWT